MAGRARDICSCLTTVFYFEARSFNGGFNRAIDIKSASQIAYGDQNVGIVNQEAYISEVVSIHGAPYSKSSGVHSNGGQKTH